MTLVYKLKHYKVKTPFCDICGKMLANKIAQDHKWCNHCQGKL